MILIVGAGPAGLSAAYHLESEYVLLEQEPQPGGLCRSFELGGTTFDMGGHAFFTRHDYVRELVSRLSRTGLHTQPRRAWVYSHGTYVPYPFQSNLYGLPLDVVRDCLVGLYEVASTRTDRSSGNLQEWIDRSFGRGIAKHFLTPYNQKLWAFPLEDVVPDWASQRIVTPDFGPIVAGALGRVNFEDFPNATVSYPAEGGFFELYRGLASSVEDRLRQAKVERLKLRERVVRTDAGEWLPYEQLISTMPLDELIAIADDAPTCCRSAAASLRFNSLHLVNLVFDRPNITDMQRVYCADPGICFHKLVMNSNSSQRLRSRPRFGIQAEVSWSHHKRVDRSGLEERVLTSLLEMGVVHRDDHVVDSSVVTVERAYPIYTKETKAAREHLLATLSTMAVLPAGRFGEWLYINSDDALMCGKRRADEVNGRLNGTAR